MNVDISKLIALLKKIESEAPTVIAGLTDFITKAKASPFLPILEAKFPAIKTLDDDALKVLGFLSSLEPATIAIIDELIALLSMFAPAGA